jgi:hypothetical protein
VLKAGQPNTTADADVVDVSDEAGSHEPDFEDQTQQIDAESGGQQHDNTCIVNSLSLPTFPQPSLVDDPFTPARLSELCGVWFSKYHNWFPILHSPSLFDALENFEALKAAPIFIVFKAIVAVTLTGPHYSMHITQEQRAAVSARTRSEVIMEGFANLNVRSLQALLLLGVLYQGEGTIPQFWNLLALCKRCALRSPSRDKSFSLTLEL